MKKLKRMPVIHRFRSSGQSVREFCRKERIGEHFPALLQIADDSELLRQLVGAIDELRKKVKTNKKLRLNIV
jgi:hypothetical protein